MAFTLETAAAYLNGARTPNEFNAFLKQVKETIGFHEERANRLKRFLQIIYDYKNGVGVYEITCSYGCSKNTVLRYARIAGLPQRERSFGKGTRDEVIRLYRARIPVKQIAKDLKVSPAYISRTASEEGINRHARPR